MKSLIAMAALSAAVLTAQPVAAQPGAAPSKGAAAPAASAKPPVDVVSDKAEVHNAECTEVWSGSAEALQQTASGPARLRADTLIAHLEIKKGKPSAKSKASATPDAAGGNCGDTVSLEAKGNVYYASADGRRVHGDNAVYDYPSTTITITGDVTAVQGENVMRGTKMVYNTQTGEGHMEGGAKGPGAKNRPRGVFYPKDASSDASATAPTDGTAAAPAAKPKKKKAAQ
ncbi:MAG: LptA/OstA family protein [Phenylobacterium sp.]